ncbi:MAG: glycosyltransferase [Alphaproteobacteria bacterium]|nr:glycosyltransferase [Alphaproteobacteria bacterium]
MPAKAIDPPRLSIVIPALNAGGTLGAVLASLGDGFGDGPGEVIVVDGGSSDQTTAIAGAAGAQVIKAVPGRGVQLAAGADAAAGAWLLFLHADTVLGPTWQEVVRRFMMAHETDHQAAAFRFRLDDGAALARILERVVAIRVRLLGLPYGDQGLLISAAHYKAIGGFRSLPLMEDVDIVRRIGRARLHRLPGDALTSALRYRQGGYLRRPLRNILCLMLYFTGVPPRLIARIYR